MHEAAAEIERLRLELSVQKACTVAGSRSSREEIARLRLTAEERVAVELSISKRLDMDAIYTLRKLLERLA